MKMEDKIILKTMKVHLNMKSTMIFKNSICTGTYFTKSFEIYTF